MLPREILFESDLSIGDSGTRTINLDIVDPISQLIVYLRMTNGATSVKACPPSHCITKIELVDGGDVLWSLSGIETRALYSHLHGGEQHSKISEIGGDSSYETLPINFGRYLYDRQYAFDANRFRNPQLKITWDLAAVNAVGATGFVSGSGYLTVMARLMEDVEAPSAFMSAKEVYDFTTAASGDEVIELPTDYVWRTLLVRAYEAGVSLSSSLTNLKLSIDAGKHIIFDESVAKFYRRMIAQYGLIGSSLWALASNATAYENWQAFTVNGQLTGRASGVIVATQSHDNSQTTPTVVNHANSAQTNKGILTNVYGTALENALLYSFGRPGEPTDWVNPATFGKAKLALTQGNAGASAQVVMEQVRSY